MASPLEPSEPHLPWWKQMKTRLTLASFCAVVAVLSTALWFALSSEAEKIIVAQSLSPVTPLSSPPSVAISSPPSSPPSMARVEGLFENDCDSCGPKVAVDGDTVVVARKRLDVHFFSATRSGFEIIAKIDIDYIPTVVTIHNNTAVIGSWYKTAAYVFERDQNGTWSKPMLLQPSDLCRGVQFGCDQAVWFGRAIAVDGNVMVVGAPVGSPLRGEQRQGSVYIFRRNGTTWMEEAELAPPDNSNAYDFGFSLSVKGNLVAVGDPGKWLDNNGAAFVYRFDVLSSSWNPVGGALMNIACDPMGFTVRLTDNEDLLVVCGESYTSFSTVYYYEKPRMGNEYTLKQRIRFDNVVRSLDVDQNTMVVGEFSVGRSIAVHFFVQKNNVWEEVALVEESIFNSGLGETVASSRNITLIASDRNVYLMAP